MSASQADHALSVLDWPSIRERLAASCQTQPGEVLASQIAPRFDDEGVWFEIGRTEEAADLLGAARLDLHGLKDVAEPVSRAGKGATLDGSTLAACSGSLRSMSGARAALESRREAAPRLWLLGQRFPVLPGLAQELDRCLDGDGSIKDSASPELAAARTKLARAAQRILERIQKYVSGRTRELLSDSVYTLRDGRYVIPLKAENRGKIKGIVHDSSASGQTIYLEPEDVVQLGNTAREAEGEVREEEQRILRNLSEQVGSHAAEIVDGLRAAAELDLVLAKARLGAESGGCIPQRDPRPGFVCLVTARHPLLPASTAVPLSLEVGGETTVMLITGPNTGGKTVAIKTVGLAVAMAQAGLMPTAQAMTFGAFSQLWADIGDEQSLQQSLSTFSGHIKNISEALARLKPGALVLVDEVGAGTDPAEGAALGRALLLQFQASGAVVLASTHYGELKILASNAAGFMNAAMEFDQKTLAPTYRLLPGVPGASHALKIAERFGIPKSVLNEAQAGFGAEHLDIARMIEKLEQAQKQAQRAQGEADRLAGQLRQVESEVAKTVAAAEDRRRKAREEAAEELSEALKELRDEAAELFSTLKSNPSQAEIEQVRAGLKRLQEKGAQRVKAFKPEVEVSAAPPMKLVKGMSVRVQGMDKVGTLVEEPRGANAVVQVGALKMTVPVTNLRAAERSKSKPPPRQGSVSVAKALTAQSEIHLRQMRAEDAAEVLDKFLDEAVLGGVRTVRIVHGKGEGILRKVTRERLRAHPAVGSFRDGESGEGGLGVTIAVLE